MVDEWLASVQPRRPLGLRLKLGTTLRGLCGSYGGVKEMLCMRSDWILKGIWTSSATDLNLRGIGVVLRELWKSLERWSSHGALEKLLGWLAGWLANERTSIQSYPQSSPQGSPQSSPQGSLSTFSDLFPNSSRAPSVLLQNLFRSVSGLFHKSVWTRPELFQSFFKTPP